MTDSDSADTTETRARCATCGRIVAAEDCVAFAGKSICAACKPEYFQKLREGMPEKGPPAVTFLRRMLSLYLYALSCGVLQIVLIYLAGNTLSRYEWAPLIAGLCASGGCVLLLHQILRWRLKLPAREFPGQMLLPCVLLMALLFLLAGMSCGAFYLITLTDDGFRPVSLIFSIPFFLAVIPFEILVWSFALLLAMLAWGKFRTARGR